LNIKESIRVFVYEISAANDLEVEVEDDESLIFAGILDSLSILNLLSFLDEKFGIVLNGNEINPSNFETINLIHSFVAERINKNIES
jgi:acyl carrier protein